MKIKPTLTLTIILLFQFQGIAQPITQPSQSCTFYGDVLFEQPTIEGTIVTNPKGEVNVNNYYTLPMEKVERITNEIKELKQLKMEVSSQQLSLERKEQILKQKEEQIKKEQQKILEDRFVVRQSQNNIEEVKRNFELEMQKVKAEFKDVVNSLPQLSENEPIANKIQELKTTGESILASAENCMSNDFTLHQLKDKTTNKIVYGFSLEEIRNDPNYVFIDKYVEGIARVKRNNKYGFYNNKGELIIGFKYDNAEPFNDGIAAVNNFGKWFLIDKNGEKRFDIYEKNIQFVKNFSKGFYRVKTKESDDIDYYYLYDGNGKKHLEEYAIINPIGKDGLALVQHKQKEVRFKGSKGLINEEGQFILDCKYNNISEFNNAGLAIVDLYKNKFFFNRYGGDYLKGVVNSKGEFIVECKYKGMRPFNEYGIAPVMNKRFLWGVINTNGKLIVPCKYKSISQFNKFGLAKFKNKRSNLFGIIDRFGEVLVSNKYYRIDKFENNGVALTTDMKSNKGLINAKGHVLVVNRYRDIKWFNSFDSLFLVSNAEIIEGKHSKNNNASFTPSDSYSQYKIGLVNLKGKVTQEPIFGKVYEFDVNGYAMVGTNDEGEYSWKYGLINKQGKLVLDCKYEKILGSFGKDQCAIVRKQPNVYVITEGYTQTFVDGVVNLNGLEFIPCIFNSVKRINGGFEVLLVSKKYGKSSNTKTYFKVNYDGRCFSENKTQYDELIKGYYKRK